MYPNHLVWNPEIQECGRGGCEPQEASDSCPLGWLQNKMVCYLYVGGAQNFTQARASCEGQYSMLVNLATKSERAFAISILRSRAVGERSFGIWTETWDKEDGKCPLFNLSSIAGNAHIYKDDCFSLSPYICKRSAVNECPNGCTYNGRCGKDKRCHCNRGWEGKDCSVYHCRDRNKCGQYGTCVGPNQCRCQPGWQGRACSVSYCPVYSTCRSCTEQPGCGWCDHKQRCLPGHESQPWREQCGTWFYHDCFSVDTHMGCSSQVEYIGCDYRHRNSTIRYSNDELCHRCRDVEACFIDDISYSCRQWDMRKCPNGLVRQVYNHGDRALDTTLHAHVKVIKPGNAEFYVCPISNTEQRGHSILVTRDKVKYPRSKDFVIVSKQAGGIMHKVYATQEKGTYQYFAAVRASLEDVIQYANFNQIVPVRSLMDDRTLEHVPEERIFKIAYMWEGAAIRGSLVHVLKDDHVFKCLGHWYNVTIRPVASQYIVLRQSMSKHINVCDVVVSGESQGQGFLEDIEDIVTESEAVTYHAKVKTCCQAMSFSPIAVSPVSTSNTMYCHGGEQNDRSLHISESVNQETAPPVVGDVIPGRTSGAFLGQVISRFEKGGYIFLECIPIQDLNKDTVLTSAPYTIFHPDRRLNNQISTDGIFTSLKKEAVFETTSVLRKQLSVDMNIVVTAGLQLHLQSTVPKAQKIGIRLDATVDYNMNNSYEALVRNTEFNEDHYAPRAF
ncbi:uncharacterized protein LOC106155530 [Lingula anatina]|uniref:Uncharacterized protein LOC106155530 n=1 Tax=Lingula anatina TaxID=7574 RepID=A0A1S3HIN5_LINAN|nr:uncharacterized protein LOC106155530 [Lingula anatina]|eukprot:XP_013385867.1 uncharacterized protein LOC106155530 [Lingula anatina]